MTNRGHTVTACILAIVGLYVLRLNSVEIQPNAEGAFALAAKHYGGNTLTHSYLPIGGTAAVVSVLGESPIAVRFFTIVCSALALLLTYVIARRFVSYQGAILALCFVASAMPWVTASRSANAAIPCAAFALCTAWLLMERRWLYAIPSLLAMVLSIPGANTADMYHLVAIAVPLIAISGMIMFERLMQAGSQRALFALYGLLLASASTVITSSIVVSVGICVLVGIAALLFSKNVLTYIVIRGYNPVLRCTVAVFFANVVFHMWFGSNLVVRGGREIAATLSEAGQPVATYLRHTQDADSTVNTQLQWYTKEQGSFTLVTLHNDSEVVGTVAEISATGVSRVVYYHPNVSSQTLTLVQAAFAPLYDVELNLPHYTLFTLR